MIWLVISLCLLVPIICIVGGYFAGKLGQPKRTEFDVPWIDYMTVQRNPGPDLVLPPPMPRVKYGK